MLLLLHLICSVDLETLIHATAAAFDVFCRPWNVNSCCCCCIWFGNMFITTIFIVIVQVKDVVLSTSVSQSSVSLEPEPYTADFDSSELWWKRCQDQHKQHRTESLMLKKQKTAATTKNQFYSQKVTRTYTKTRTIMLKGQYHWPAHNTCQWWLWKRLFWWVWLNSW